MRKRSSIKGPIIFGPAKVPVYSDQGGNLFLQVSETKTVIIPTENAARLLRELSKSAYQKTDCPPEKRI